MNWQPIETAPKDGREIVALGIRRGEWGYADDQVEWTGIRWAEQWVHGEHVAGWRETKPTPRYSTGFTPTKWLCVVPPPPVCGVKG